MTKKENAVADVGSMPQGRYEGMSDDDICICDVCLELISASRPQADICADCADAFRKGEDSVRVAAVAFVEAQESLDAVRMAISFATLRRAVGK